MQELCPGPKHKDTWVDGWYLRSIGNHGNYLADIGRRRSIRLAHGQRGGLEKHFSLNWTSGLLALSARLVPRDIVSSICTRWPKSLCNLLYFYHEKGDLALYCK